ncbi:hypothetical protein QCA50_002234 [Cerrena zonata]|uniref:CASTOR ACT domain-containing protein n=1 Tax=Cerrena zonata TaxID=2478898 RepID=A0AAW0GNJ5_9APHY
MPPPSPADHEAFRLELLDGLFFVKQLKHNEVIPEDVLRKLTNPSAELISVTRTNEEISIAGQAEEGDSEASWRCIKIAGPMDFDVTGVVAGFTAPLKTAEVPVFAISTWNTDYVLVAKEKVEVAIAALEEDGWKFNSKPGL